MKKTKLFFRSLALLLLTVLLVPFGAVASAAGGKLPDIAIPLFRGGVPGLPGGRCQPRH